MSKNPYDVPDVIRIKIEVIGDEFADFTDVDYTIHAGEIGTVIEVMDDTHVMLEFDNGEYDPRTKVVDIKDIEMVDKYSEKLKKQR